MAPIDNKYSLIVLRVVPVKHVSSTIRTFLPFIFSISIISVIILPFELDWIFNTIENNEALKFWFPKDENYEPENVFEMENPFRLNGQIRIDSLLKRGLYHVGNLLIANMPNTVKKAVNKIVNSKI